VAQSRSSKATIGINTINVLPSGQTRTPATDLATVAVYIDAPDSAQALVNGDQLNFTSGGKIDSVSFMPRPFRRRMDSYRPFRATFH
jgi:hypothetical protein